MWSSPADDVADYRQNPTKIYNGVRHQTSMCKAFVKLPRPFGDQSGGARKWAIRAGCESWFSGGGYHPPGANSAPTSTKGKAGKAKTTARSKHLAIGTDLPIGGTTPTSTGDKKPFASYSSGPSSGPAFDGSSRDPSLAPLAYPQPAYPNYLPPGYHYVPVPASHGHQQSSGGQPVYVPVWGGYGAPMPQSFTHSRSAEQMPDSEMSSPDHWRHHHSGESDNGSRGSFEQHQVGASPPSGRGQRLEAQGTSPERR